MLMRTDPFRELDRWAGHVWGGAFRGGAVPRDAYRRGDSVVVNFELPGVAPRTIDVTARRALRPGGGPPSGVLVLSLGDRPGARPAADRRVALLHEGVDDHVVVGDVAGHVEIGPRGQRVDLDQAPSVQRHDAGVGPRRRLGAA